MENQVSQPGPCNHVAVRPVPVPQPGGRCRKEQAHDDLVMSTNSSSIASKRSVESLYYPNEPHFFRFFVKKCPRRSPLINRGYHLRLHVIDVAVRTFLARPSSKKKVVVNLGCGSDVLPWQCMTRYPEDCKDAKFIDIDFPHLMAKKSTIVRETPELSAMLTGVETGQHPCLLLRSDQYAQIGCDLRNLDDIHDALASVVSIEHSEFLFVAEVSITYMETEAADAVIRWASGLGQAEFCLLEQIIPDGADHPFAETMLKHFEKLRTPLKSVFAYPDLTAQEGRFRRLGWTQADAESLWSAWSSDKYFPPAVRNGLNGVEPFDEWEEFAIFAGHYCIVTARTWTENPLPSKERRPSLEGGCLPAELAFSDTETRGQRRFGAAMVVENPPGGEWVTNLFGLGNTSRIRSYDIFGCHHPAKDVKIFTTGPSSRMCHTITDLGDHGHLLVGGRTNPASPLQDCWLFDKLEKSWQKLEDLPVPLYRHAVTRLPGTSLALAVGGKTNSASVFRGCLLYRPLSGWKEVEILGSAYTPVSGAAFAAFRRKTGCLQGFLAGGLLEDGTVAQQTLHWHLELPADGKPTIMFNHIQDLKSSLEPARVLDPRTSINRFGAAVLVDEEDRVFMLGGVIEGHVLPKNQEVQLLSWRLTDGSGQSTRVEETAAAKSAGTVLFATGLKLHGNAEAPVSPRPLLVGTSVAFTADGVPLLMGGGATCFSMGTYWNAGCYTVTVPSIVPARTGNGRKGPWNLLQTVNLTDVVAPSLPSTVSHQGQRATIFRVPRIQLRSPTAFDRVLRSGRPVVIEGGDLGPCVQKWTPEYMVARVGQERKVVVHECSSPKMDFNAKNFRYVTKGFGSFMTEVGQGRHMYLRALSKDGPADKPANLEQDFPELAEEFRLPEEMLSVAQNTFSSVLRITGPTNMWLHYDVMANVYCQVLGSKRLVLFPPSDVTQLSFAPGASSSSIDVFAELDQPSLAGTHPHEAELKPGDVLFLPPLWLHAATPLTTLGVAVNVFFRNLETGYASGRDVYGNRDLAAYEKGRRDVSMILKSFQKVPSDMREFYVRRLADELLQKVHG